MRIDPAIIAREVAALLAAHPELADDEALRLDTIEGETSVHEVLSRVVRDAQDSAASARAVKEQETTLSSRRGRFERREDALRTLAHRIMTAAGLRKVELPEATLSLSAKGPGLHLDDGVADKLPDDLVKIERKPDRGKIKRAMLDGREVYGARITNGGETFNLRAS